MKKELRNFDKRLWKANSFLKSVVDSRLVVCCSDILSLFKYVINEMITCVKIYR
jgi:hypothetical protein